MDAPGTEPPLRLSQKKKLKKNFTGKKRLIFVSKSLYDLKVKGSSRKILSGHLAFVMNAFYVFLLIFRSVLGGGYMS